MDTDRRDKFPAASSLSSSDGQLEPGTVIRVTPAQGGDPWAQPTYRLRKPIIQWQEFGEMTAGLLRRRRDLKAIWFHDRLDPGFRETIMLAVAGANTCRQCSYAHREWALAEGVLEAELAALEGLDAESFDPRTWAAIAWSQAAARSDFAHVSDAIDANFHKWFTDQESADIEVTARTMCWMNRVSNTVDAALERLRRHPEPDSGLGREVVAVVIYGLVVPVVLIVLAVKQKRRPMDLVRGVIPFFQDFAARQLQVLSESLSGSNATEPHSV